MFSPGAAVFATAPANRACNPTGLGAITGGGGFPAATCGFPVSGMGVPLDKGGEEVISRSLNVDTVVRLDCEVIFGRASCAAEPCDAVDPATGADPCDPEAAGADKDEPNGRGEGGALDAGVCDPDPVPRPNPSPCTPVPLPLG